METKIRCLEMIQGVINRMASNSFALKGWAVTLVAGVFVLADKACDKTYFLVAYIPVFIFWLLDSYYLYQERLYRKLFAVTRKLPEAEVDFDMNANKEEFKDKKNNYLSSALSITELGFYLPLAVVCSLIIIIGA